MFSSPRHYHQQCRRVVNVHAEAWQDEHARPIASLRGHFLLANEG